MKKQYTPTEAACLVREHSSQEEEVKYYQYPDRENNPLFEKVRRHGKRFSLRRLVDGKYVYNIDGVEPVLYQLPQVLDAMEDQQLVFIVEGEKDADNCAARGLAATTNYDGANGKWLTSYSETLHGANVVIVPDNDAPGHEHAVKIASALLGCTASVKVVVLPGLSVKGDISDWFESGGTREQLLELVERTPSWMPDESRPDRDDNLEDDKTSEPQPRKSQSTVLIELALEAGLELWHTAEMKAYATIAKDGHREHYAVRSMSMRQWLAGVFYRATGKALGSQAAQDTISLFEAKAVHEGAEYLIFTRIAEHDGRFYLDLCNASWEVVEITASGWHIVKDAPVRFRRPRGMLSLPTPITGGSISNLRAFINFEECHLPLVVAWLLSTLRPQGPYPALCLHSEQGSGKSTACRILRAVSDPSAAPLRSSPRDERDLVIAASNSWIVCLDNVSHLPPWLSDALCRLSTGGGFTTRELYTDAEEVIFEAQRPIIINGITEVITRSDLLDRSVIVSLRTIDEEQRVSEAELWSRFEESRPAILGALLDAVADGIRKLPEIKLARKPRMADFALWATATEVAAGFLPGTFMSAYNDSRDAGYHLAMESSPIGGVLVEFMRSLLVGSWCGTASELLTELGQRVDEMVRKSPAWPKTATNFSSHLRRLAPSLRALGMGVEFSRSATGRFIRLTRANGKASDFSVTAVRSDMCSEGAELFPHEPDAE